MLCSVKLYRKGFSPVRLGTPVVGVPRMVTAYHIKYLLVKEVLKKKPLTDIYL